MANPAQHGNDMKLVDEVDGGLPADDADDEDSSGDDGEDEELLDDEE